MQDENHKVTLEGQRPETHCPVKLKITQPWNYTVLNAACESGTEGTLLQSRTTAGDLCGLMQALTLAAGVTLNHIAVTDLRNTAPPH